MYLFILIFFLINKTLFCSTSPHRVKIQIEETEYLENLQAANQDFLQNVFELGGVNTRKSFPFNKEKKI